MENSGLTKSDIDRIMDIFSKYTQIEEVVLYGSRAKGNFEPASDIDLTLVGENIDSSLQQEIEFELDDLLLPYKFDVSIYDKLTNPEFKAHIDRVGKVFYNKTKDEISKLPVSCNRSSSKI